MDVEEIELLRKEKAAHDALLPEKKKSLQLDIADFPASVQAQLREIDDDGSGILDEKELTEMAKMYSDMKKASAEGCIAISTLPKEIQSTLEVFDVDGDGSVAPIELARAAELYKQSKDRSKMLGKIVAGLSLVLILLVFAIVGMTAQVIEMSKETATSADGITTVAGSNQPAATGQIEVQDSLSDAYGWTPDQLNGVKSLYFPEKNEEACPSSTYCPDGSELAYTVTGWARNAEAGLTFYTARGDTVNVQASGAASVEDSDGAIIYTMSATEGRRRMQDNDFGGSLMTSGSFTMVGGGGF